MKLVIKKLLLFVMAVVFVASITVEAQASTLSDLNSAKKIYKVYNYRTGDSWLTANTYMIKRKARLDGNGKWYNVCNDTDYKLAAGGQGVRSVACTSANACFNVMKKSYSYSNNGDKYYVYRKSLTGTKAEKLAQMKAALKKHPEGIAIYGPKAGPGYAHAVLLTDYTGGKLYCLDPLLNIASNNTSKKAWNNNYSILNEGRTTLAESKIKGINYLTEYMYISKVVTSDISYKHTIHFTDSDGKTALGDAVTVNDGADISLFEPEKAGYNFKGWYLKRLKDGTWSSDSGQWSTAAADRILHTESKLTLDKTWTSPAAGLNLKCPDSNYRFQAKWVPATYIYNFDTNGGTGTFNTKTLAYSNTFNVPAEIPRKDGCTFKGWYVKRTTDNTWYVAGDGWISDSEIDQYTRKLYAAGRTLKINDSWTSGKGGDMNFTFYAVFELNKTHSALGFTSKAPGGGLLESENVVEAYPVTEAEVGDSVFAAIQSDGWAEVKRYDFYLQGPSDEDKVLVYSTGDISEGNKWYYASTEIVINEPGTYKLWIFQENQNGDTWLHPGNKGGYRSLTVTGEPVIVDPVDPADSDKKLVYRYRDKVFKDSAEETLEGYEKINTTTDTSYTGWTGHSDKYTDSDVTYDAYREVVTVESKTAYKSTTYYCSECRKVCWQKSNTTACKYCGTTTKVRLNVYSSISLEDSGYELDTSDGSYTLPATIDQNAPDKLGEIYTMGLDGAGITSFTTGSAAGCIWIWPKGTDTIYRAKTEKIATHFWKWGEWSEWSETPVTETSTREVETMEVDE